MRKSALFLGLVFPVMAFANGAVILQLQADGSSRFYTEGEASGGADTLSVLQQPGKTATVMFQPVMPAQCQDGNLQVGALQISLNMLANNQKIRCGEFVELRPTASGRQVAMRLRQQVSSQKVRTLTAYLPTTQRQQMGDITIQTGDENSQRYPLYVDYSQLQAESSVLTARFESPALELGLVGPDNGAVASAKLLVSKTENAPSALVPYQLSFESTQQQGTTYRLRSSLQEKLIPYGIFVEGQQLDPGTAWHGQVPVGIATTDRVNIEFHLPGKATRGMAAGARLLDTITAVITPDS